MDNIVHKENAEKGADTYDQFVGANLCLPDEQGRKMMTRVTERVEEN